MIRKRGTGNDRRRRRKPENTQEKGRMNYKICCIRWELGTENRSSSDIPNTAHKRKISKKSSSSKTSPTETEARHTSEYRFRIRQGETGICIDEDIEVKNKWAFGNRSYQVRAWLCPLDYKFTLVLWSAYSEVHAYFSSFWVKLWGTPGGLNLAGGRTSKPIALILLGPQVHVDVYISWVAGM